MKTENTVTKHQQVFDYLKRHGSITSWIAIEKFGATRLSSIIFNIRKIGKSTGTFSVKTMPIKFTDKFKNKSTYAKYILVKTVK